MITVAVKMPSHYGIAIVFDVKDVTLECINDSVFRLSCILYLAPVEFKTIYEIVTLACAFGHCVVGCMIVQVYDFP